MIQKTPAELEQEIIAAITTQGCNQQKEFNTLYTGDMSMDFSQFTADQSGRISSDPADPASKNPPPEPKMLNGYPVHTILDVTWSTYHSILPNNTSSQFYEMSAADRMQCVMSYINVGKITSSDLVNTLVSYINWGGALYICLNVYKVWYPDSNLQLDVKLSEHDAFIKLIDVRRYVYTNCLTDSNLYALGWDRGILNFYKLFIQYAL